MQVYFYNLTPRIKSNTPELLLLKSKMKPIFARKSSVFETIITNLTEKVLIMQFRMTNTQLKKLRFNIKLTFLAFQVHPRQKVKGALKLSRVQSMVKNTRRKSIQNFILKIESLFIPKSIEIYHNFCISSAYYNLVEIKQLSCSELPEKYIISMCIKVY